MLIINSSGLRAQHVSQPQQSKGAIHARHADRFAGLSKPGLELCLTRDTRQAAPKSNPAVLQADLLRTLLVASVVLLLKRRRRLSSVF